MKSDSVGIGEADLISSEAKAEDFIRACEDFIVQSVAKQLRTISFIKSNPKCFAKYKNESLSSSGSAKNSRVSEYPSFIIDIYVAWWYNYIKIDFSVQRSLSWIGVHCF